MAILFIIIILFQTGLFFIWGIIFIFITILIAILKKEKDSRLEDEHVELNIFQNYTLLWGILKLPSVKILAIALLTAKVLIKKKYYKYKLYKLFFFHFIIEMDIIMF